MPFSTPDNSAVKTTTVEPLSAAQLGVWFAHQLDPDKVRYNVAEQVIVRGPVDVDVFRSVLREVLDGVTALHVRLRQVGELPEQVLGPPAQWSLPVVDLRAEPDAAAAAEKWMSADLDTPVDLLSGPLFTTALFLLEDDLLVWYQRVHDILLDSYGFHLVRRQVAARYAATLGSFVDSVEFGDYAVLLAEQRAVRTDERHRLARKYWTSRFADRPGPTSLASGTSGSPHPDRRFNRATGELTGELLDAVGRAAASSGVLWGSVLAAAFAGYVHRVTGAQEVVLALPVSGRVTASADRVPAMCAGRVPLRLHVAGQSPAALARSAGSAFLAALRHQVYGLEELNRDLGLVASGRQITGPSVNLTPFDDELWFGPHRAEVRSLANGPVEDLTLTVYGLSAGTRRVDVDTNPARYSIADTERHLAGFLEFLAEFARDVLAPPRQDGRIDQASHVADVSGPPRCVLAEFADRVREHPHAVAVRDTETSLTFAELDLLSARLAGHLRGTSPEPVGVLLPRSADLMVALLGVLRSGNPYVPIDPATPPARTAELLRLAGVRRVVTDAETVPGGAVPVSVNPGGTGAGDLEPPRPDSVAYVMFTSGSTGQPKGVVVEHRSLRNLFRYLDRTVFRPTAEGAGRQLRTAHLASCAFDASISQALWLIGGHSVRVVEEPVKRDPVALLSLVDEERIDVLPLTPAHARELLAQGLGDQHRVRLLWLGGEAVDPQLWTRIRGIPGMAAVNCYGPTECTVDTTTAWLSDSSTPVIGTPVDGTRIHLLDDRLRPVPDGAIGELHVSGAALSRGYLDPVLTAARFIADPFGAPGDRMYRTGDLARRLPSGAFEFHGRADAQLKIRGHRLEPGEVEHVLRADPDVVDAAVAGVPDRHGDLRLVAHVVFSSGSADPERLRRSASRALPPHAVPDVIRAHDRLPRNANGKIDRARLPAVDFTGQGGRAASETERLVCELFQDVLGVPDIGPDDNFFRLGGHSLSAARLINRLLSRTGKRVRMAEFFDAPTPAAVARALDH